MTMDERDRLIVLETQMKDIDKKLDKVIEDHETRLRCLESKPGKRWETIVAVVITAAATLAINFLVR